MATYHEYFSPTALAVDFSGRGFFEEEDSKPLDERMLERPLDATTVTEDFSPKTATEWAEFSDQETLSSTTSTNTFFRPPPPGANPVVAFRPAMDSWESNSCTPTPAYNDFRSDFDPASSTTAYLAGAAGPIGLNSAGPSAFELHNGHETRTVPVFHPTAVATDNSSFPTSPLDGWTSPTIADQMDPRAGPKRARPGSPGVPHSPLLRRDGIRKKNARFEIPAERNLLNIDQLIAQSSDDQEIKELKQQKRLLRNRQAALDSRQRKKQHTERLEEEKKHYTTIISELEEECAQLKLQETEFFRREEEWKAAQQRYEQFIESMHMEKEEMIRRHTLETADLRKKNAFLSEHIQKADAAVTGPTTMSTVPSSSGFSADFSDADGLAMDGHSWDPYPPFLQDFAVEPEVKPEPTMALASRRAEGPKLAVVEEDRPVSSSVLLLLLLFGAFVASRNPTSSAPNLPRMPENIRVASATVLDNIFKDAGVAQQDPRLGTATRVEALEPGPSGAAWPGSQMVSGVAGHGNSNLIGLTSSIDMLLTGPTKEQEDEQLFSLTADQYNGVVSADAYGEPESMSMSHAPPPPPRDFGLATMRGANNQYKGSAAEVYTRSLLWDKVPAEVVRDFARFVADSAAHDERQKAANSVGG
ncbi:MAG: hypothetical protein M1816_003286 [Peltula sp. TS41687]|nr:MAG: hypothetical protein M1816_003286 [Peltula sp. TS41687]